MKKSLVHIKGMHCRSCEILIEDELKKIKGVSQVQVDHQNGTAEVFHKTNHLDKNEIVQAVRSAGYEVGTEEKKPFLSKNINDYLDIGIAAVVLTIIFMFANDLGLFKLAFGSSNNLSSLPVVFMIGITAGLSTCMALVGGLVLGASARFSEKHPYATALQKFKPHIFFNIGRIVSFFILGGIIGAAGSLFQLTPTTLGLLTIAVGLVMLMLGLQLTNLFPRMNSLSFTLPKEIGKMLGINDKKDQEYSHKNSMIMGGLTFFLPCGFTQAMQLFAISSGNALTGALTMGVFAIGTAPGLLGIGGLTSAIKGAFAKSFFKFAGLIVIALAFFNISNGYNLTGFNFLSSFSPGMNVQASDPNVTLENGVQVVKMTQGLSGYSPNQFTIKKDIPVKWIINSVEVNTCASTIVSQKLGVRKTLQLGDNIIEFTPTEIGSINFSCTMGMYTGVFNVVDGNGNKSTSSGQATTQAVQNNTANIGSCGGGSGSCGGGGGCGCGGGVKKTQPETNITPVAPSEISGKQVIKAIYTSGNDIEPTQFTVKAGQPVRFEIDAKDDGSGCMGSVTVPGLTKDVQVFAKGQTNVFEFTPEKPGKYNITCAMGVPRGSIIVN